MKQIFFRPDDVLFFRDGRPMEGATSGQGARMPAPHVLNSALHNACHRAFGSDAAIGHTHRANSRPREGRQHAVQRTERFGALFSCGPFPVRGSNSDEWYFPVPADLTRNDTLPAVLPVAESLFPGSGSTHSLLPLGNRQPPSKETPPHWLSKSAFESYLNGSALYSATDTTPTTHPAFLTNSDVFLEEATIGIGIDPATSTTVRGRFYSKVQMRLNPHFRLGAYATLPHSHQPDSDDILERLFPDNGRISLGGESRTCSVDCQTAAHINLPVGATIKGNLVKWVLLTPAIFPYLSAHKRAHGVAHPGGWLPSWVEPAQQNGQSGFRVLLLDGPGAAKAARMKCTPGQPIRANLVAARIERAIPVTGWSMPGSSAGEVHASGARSTLLAVPAGSVYYFIAEDEAHARKLADALNWHGSHSLDHAPTAIVNRRSTLLGEKGYGLGVCGSWDYFSK